MGTWIESRLCLFGTERMALPGGTQVHDQAPVRLPRELFCPHPVITVTWPQLGSS